MASHLKHALKHTECPVVTRNAVKRVLRGYTLRMYVVYVIQSQKDRQLYVGFTENMQQRIATHNKGSVPSTKSRRPWKLIYCECYTDKNDAMRREKYFKTTPGKGAIKHMLRETLKSTNHDAVSLKRNI